MAILWFVLGVGAVFLLLTVVGRFGGRGHLGADKTPDQYLNEVESLRKSGLF